LLTALVFALPLQAANLPDLGDSSGRVLDANAERVLGRQVMQQLRGSGGYMEDPEVNAYLEQIGHRLTNADPTIEGEFQFFAVPSREINAFALPGGYVGVNTGLILLTQSESELASVLAHEISHVTQHHIARQMEGQSASQLAMLAGLAAAVLAGASGNGQVAQAAMIGSLAGQAQSQINYTREHEREADRIGMNLLQQSGFDPSAMATFFQRMQQATRVQENNAPGYLRSHPLNTERIANAQDRALAAPYRQVPDSVDYLLVRALIRSYEGTPEEAVALLKGQLTASRPEQRNAARYGLAATHLRANNYAEGMAEILALDKAGFHHPMVEAMAGQLLQQGGRLPDALSRYEAALARYPNHLQLVYDYPRALILARKDKEAAEFAEARLRSERQDASLHRLAAEAHAHLAHQTQSHYHQGEAYALEGQRREAIQQLELALRARDASEPQLMIIEERLLALRQEQLRERSQPGFRPERPDRPGLSPANTGGNLAGFASNRP
jgi:predicted Zn-dependent protease